MEFMIVISTVRLYLDKELEISCAPDQAQRFLFKSNSLKDLKDKFASTVKEKNWTVSDLYGFGFTINTKECQLNSFIFCKERKVTDDENREFLDGIV